MRSRVSIEVCLSDIELIWCHFAELKKGSVDFDKSIEEHNSEVVIFDLSAPCNENWHFFKTMCDARTRRAAPWC